MVETKYQGQTDILKQSFDETLKNPNSTMKKLLAGVANGDKEFEALAGTTSAPPENIAVLKEKLCPCFLLHYLKEMYFYIVEKSNQGSGWWGRSSTTVAPKKELVDKMLKQALRILSVDENRNQISSELHKLLSDPTLTGSKEFKVLFDSFIKLTMLAIVHPINSNLFGDVFSAFTAFLEKTTEAKASGTEQKEAYKDILLSIIKPREPSPSQNGMGNV